MLWFRLYHELLDDRKVQTLPDARFRQYINLMCLANLSEPRGSLPCIEDIAFRLRLDEEVANEMMNFFTAKGFIDESDEAPWSIHGWDARQKKSDNVTARVQEHRAKRSEPETIPEPEAESDGICGNVPETLPERSGNALEKSREDTETDTENGGMSAPRSRTRHHSGFSSESFEYRMSLLLRDRMQINNPTTRAPTESQLQSWADTVRLMQQVDGRNEADIEPLLAWSQDDEFWRKNVLSMGKFRDQFDRLTLERATPPPKPRGKPQPWEDGGFVNADKAKRQGIYVEDAVTR